MQLKYFFSTLLLACAIQSLQIFRNDHEEGSNVIQGKSRSKLATSTALKLKLPKIYAGHAALTGGISWLLYSYFGKSSSLFYSVAMLSFNLFNFLIFRLDDFSSIRREMKCSNALNGDRELYDLVQSVAKSSNIPPVKGVWIVPTSELNAFACGTSQRNSNIMVTKGLRDKLSFQELKAVIAHECGHIKNKDMSMNSHLIPILMSYDFLFRTGCSILYALSRRENAEHIDDYSKHVLDTTLYLLDNDIETDSKNATTIDSQSQIKTNTNNQVKKKSKEELAKYCGYFLFTVGGVFYLLGKLLTRLASRKMEFDADYHAAKICGNDEMISALIKISGENELSIRCC